MCIVVSDFWVFLPDLDILWHIFVIRDCERECAQFPSSNTATESLLRKLLSTFELAARQMAAAREQWLVL